MTESAPPDNSKYEELELESEQILIITEDAAKKLSEMKPSSADTRFVLRVVASVKEEDPSSLSYDMYFGESFELGRDLAGKSEGIDYVTDSLSTKRLMGCTIDWNEYGSGFHFSNPNWPRKRLDREPWEAKPQPDSPRFAGYSLLAILMVLLPIAGLLLRFGSIVSEQEEKRALQEQGNTKALQKTAEDWSIKLRRGEDVDESILLFAGIDPVEYKRLQPGLQAKAKLEFEVSP